MIKLRFWVIPVVVSVFFVFPWAVPISLSSDFFPLEEGIHWSYTNDIQARTWGVDVYEGTEVVPLSFSWPMFQGQTLLAVDDPMGPMLKGITIHDATEMGNGGWLADSWTFLFESPVRLFDLPLNPGSQLVDILPTGYEDVFFQRTVGQVETLETPYGTLSAYPIHLRDLFSHFSPIVLYVHSDLGVVGFNDGLLTSVSGIVSVENKTWDEVKSIYR